MARRAAGDLAGALEAFNEAMRLDPNQSVMYWNRGYTRSRLGDSQGAIDDYTRAIAINPNFAFAYHDRAVERSRQDDRRGAIEDYTRALEINPNYALAYLNRGRARRAQGELQGAIEDFTQALQISPSSSAYYSRGLARATLGDNTGAVTDYTQALRLDPESRDAYASRGLARYRLGEDAAAIEDYSRALQIRPTAPTLFNRALARARLGDVGGAIEDYTRALEMDSAYANALYNRGRMRARVGDRPGAEQDLQRAAALYAERGDTAAERRALDQIRTVQAGATLPEVTAPPPVAEAPAVSDAPRPSADTPAAVAAAREPGRVLVRDDFSNPSSGWSRSPRNPEIIELGYGDGEYFVAKPAGRRSTWSVVWWPREAFVDFQVEVDARLLSPTEGSYLAAVFRRQENGDQYFFAVDPSAGTFRLMRHVGTSRTNLIPWTHSAVIRTGEATNRLGVRAHGSDIVLLVNGQEVGRVRDDRLREGWIGFGVGSLDDERIEGRFSNFVITSVD